MAAKVLLPDHATELGRKPAQEDRILPLGLARRDGSRGKKGHQLASLDGEPVQVGTDGW